MIHIYCIGFRQFLLAKKSTKNIISNPMPFFNLSYNESLIKLWKIEFSEQALYTNLNGTGLSLNLPPRLSSSREPD